MENSHNIIKNYELNFGELGIQFKFNKDISSSDIKTVMYYFNQYINRLDDDFNMSKILLNNTKKDFKSIDDIQN